MSLSESAFSLVKEEEIDLLLELSGSKSTKIKYSNSLEMIDYKASLMREIKSKAVLDIKYPITNYSSNIIDLYGNRISYRYAREGVIFKTDQLFPVFYPFSNLSINEDSGEFGAFISNAQAGMASIFHFLNKLYNEVVIERANQKIFFDSQNILNSIKMRGEKNKFLLIDSSVADFSVYENIELDGFAGFIFDNTCFSQNNPVFEAYLTKLVKTGKVVFLIKSLIKTDTLGVEFSHLGSLYITNLNSLSNCDYNLQKELPEFTRRFFSSCGIYAGLDQWFPFYWNRKFFELNEKRLTRMKNNLLETNTFLANLELQESRGIHYHGLFNLFEIQDTEKNLYKMSYLILLIAS